LPKKGITVFGSQLHTHLRGGKYVEAHATELSKSFEESTTSLKYFFL
jgi:Copper type II ascorbate-dependent monooxygenase, C-terminal domain